MYSLYNKNKNKFIKSNIDKKSSIYPRIISPYSQQKYGNSYKEINTMFSNNKYHFTKIPKQYIGFGNKDNRIRHKSNSGARIFHINNRNNFTRNDMAYRLNNENLSLNNISSYNTLVKLWNDFNIVNSYKDLFNLILNKLSDEEKEDLCSKEIKELSELKNNINSLLKEIKSRKKCLEHLNIFNIKLGENIMEEGNNIDDKIIKDISDEIKNLRIYTVNICFKMKKVKNKIYEGYLYGKYDLENISEKFGFDKNYLIKMKEEMNFLKEGYIKRFFNINNDFSPFLIKASEKNTNSNGEPNIYIVPLPNELKDNIKQCNFYIYQELIYYQNNKIKNPYDRIIFPCRNKNKNINYNYKGINLNDENNEMFINKSNQNFNNNNEINLSNKNDNLIKNREFNNNKNCNLEINAKNKNIQDESILFEEKGINIKDILGETNNNKYNSPNINKHNSNNMIKSDIKIFSKNVEKFSESQISKKSDLISNNSVKKFNKSSSKYSYNIFKVIIYNNYINDFNENYYNDYYKKIPQQEISMFNLNNNIISSLLTGIAPFLLLVKDENENLYGLCAFNYIYHKNKLKIKINHLSALADFNYSDYNDNLKMVYGSIINYIIKKFYFDELFVEFSKNNKNDEIYEILTKNLCFVEKSINIKRNQNESNGGDEISNNGNDKLNFLVYQNNNQINESIKDSITTFYGNNLIHFFDAILLTNTDKNQNLNNKSTAELQNLNELKYSDSDLFINIMTVNNLSKSKSNSNISNSYKRISSLEHLIKIFLQNNIDSEEIPLSVAENRYDIMCFVLNRIINEVLKNSSNLINNYNIYNSSSFLDENTGIYYNFMKPDKIYLLYDEKNEINFYIIVNNFYAIFFIKFNNQDIKKYIFKQNLYIQINEIYNELLLNKIIDVIENKLIWIPCFNIYRHLKCLINNSYFTIHEFIKITNKVINLNKKRKREDNKSYGLLFNKNLNSFLIEPQINNDIILDNDFIIGIINNASFFNKLLNNKNHPSSIINEKEKIIPSNYSIKSDNEKPKINESINSKSHKYKNITTDNINSNSNDFPNIIFLNYINKNDFINNINNNNYS